MTQHRLSAREDILSALENVLIESNGAGATLDEVAKRAGVTKGGLLYHFGSRKVLESALLDRFEELAEAEYVRMAAAPNGAAAYYAELAEYIGSALERVTIAVGMLAKRDPRAADLIRQMRTTHFDLMNVDLGDPQLARATMLIIDGMYYDLATIGEPFTPELDVAGFLTRMLATKPGGTK
ncbi:TetR family transcriptional regulator [Glaciihabitans tibetensis]|uniref:TetR family transcriptional regulator n=1 Tax=Glaciihabitans tibetensis TaxID=1266600 RepID=A0A2T0VEM2_9MICO|nr:helix-turn-helix domain-containing protein [Glaciihabitans tibetensis]PRY68627.1 TetR family transcriptional regulator [Glaciihabitans tibetensis]